MTDQTPAQALIDFIDVVIAECDARNLKPIKLTVELDDVRAELVHPPHRIHYGGPVPGREIVPVKHLGPDGFTVEPPPIAVSGAFAYRRPASWWRRILSRRSR